MPLIPQIDPDKPPPTAVLRKIVRTACSAMYQRMGGSPLVPWKEISRAHAKGEYTFVDPKRMPKGYPLIDPSLMNKEYALVWVDWFGHRQNEIGDPSSWFMFDRVFTSSLHTLPVRKDAISKEKTLKGTTEVWELVYAGWVDRCQVAGNIKYPEESKEYKEYLDQQKRTGGLDSRPHLLGLPCDPDHTPSPAFTDDEVEFVVRLLGDIPEAEKGTVSALLKSVNEMYSLLPAETEEGIWVDEENSLRRVIGLPAVLPESFAELPGVQEYLSSWIPREYFVNPFDAPKFASLPFVEHWQAQARLKGYRRHAESETLLGGKTGTFSIVLALLKILLAIGASTGKLKLPAAKPSDIDTSRFSNGDWDRGIAWLKDWLDSIKHTIDVLKATFEERSGQGASEKSSEVSQQPYSPPAWRSDTPVAGPSKPARPELPESPVGWHVDTPGVASGVSTPPPEGSRPHPRPRPRPRRRAPSSSDSEGTAMEAGQSEPVQPQVPQSPAALPQSPAAPPQSPPVWDGDTPDNAPGVDASEAGPSGLLPRPRPAASFYAENTLAAVEVQIGGGDDDARSLTDSEKDHSDTYKPDADISDEDSEGAKSDDSVDADERIPSWKKGKKVAEARKNRGSASAQEAMELARRKYEEENGITLPGVSKGPIADVVLKSHPLGVLLEPRFSFSEPWSGTANELVSRCDAIRTEAKAALQAIFENPKATFRPEDALTAIKAAELIPKHAKGLLAVVHLQRVVWERAKEQWPTIQYQYRLFSELTHDLSRLLVTVYSSIPTAPEDDSRALTVRHKLLRQLAYQVRFVYHELHDLGVVSRHFYGLLSTGWDDPNHDFSSEELNQAVNHIHEWSEATAKLAKYHRESREKTWEHWKEDLAKHPVPKSIWFRFGNPPSWQEVKGSIAPFQTKKSLRCSSTKDATSEVSVGEVNSKESSRADAGTNKDMQETSQTDGEVAQDNPAVVDEEESVAPVLSSGTATPAEPIAEKSVPKGTKKRKSAPSEEVKVPKKKRGGSGAEQASASAGNGEARTTWAGRKIKVSEKARQN